MIPHASNARSYSDLDRIAAGSTVDHKMYWGLGEVVMWLRTRDDERLAAISHLSERNAMVLAIFTYGRQLDPRSLPRLSTTNPDADPAAAPLDKDKPARIKGPVPMSPDIALDDLQRKVRSGRLLQTAVKCGRSSDEQIAVPLAELNDLVFRFTPDDPVTAAGLWSRSRGVLVWRSPQFLRSDVIRLWPARSTKTAEVSGAILRCLRNIQV